MNIQNPSVKIFVKNDGSKVIDISLIDYISEKKDANGNSIHKLDSYGIPETYTNNKGEVKEVFETESKGYRLKFEFTNDGWKTKKIIYLQDKEVVEVIAVLSGKQKECKFQRDKKTLIIQNQGAHSFITFNQDGEKFYGKSTLFTSLNIVTFGLTLLSREIYRLQGLKFTPEMLLKEIEYLTLNLSIGNETISNKENIQNEVVENPIENVNSENQENSSICADCGTHLDPIKHGKIIEFSNKKFKRTVCYNCQQKLK